jgi:hypothetical protein
VAEAAREVGMKRKLFASVWLVWTMSAVLVVNVRFAATIAWLTLRAGLECIWTSEKETA